MLILTMTTINLKQSFKYFKVPRWSTASNLIQAVRLKYFTDKKEAEFMVVCDINKENTQMVNEIQDAQVSYKLCFS